MKNSSINFIVAAFLALLFCSGTLSAQNNIGIGTATPDASAMLEILSNDKGLLAPRMTSAERLAIPAPANALLVYDTDSMCFYYYKQPITTWINLCNAFAESDPVFGASVTFGINGLDTANWNAAEANANAYTNLEIAARIADVDAEEFRAMAAEAANATAITNHVSADADLDTTNELQSLNISGSDITLSNGGGTVSVPSSADNLGNHLATTTLNLNNNWLTVMPAISADTISNGISWNGADITYGIYKESGSWTFPYPDLKIRFHTGIKLSAESAYGGVRIYANSSEALTATFNNNGLTLTGLAGIGTRMVTADASGKLSTQAIPTGDNLGNHTATTSLNLNSQSITNVKDIFTNNYGTGMVGLYSSTRYQNIFAMGSSYRLTADGTAPGSFYGLAWTHSNVGGESVAGLGHQMLLMTNGDTRTALGDGIWTKYDVTGNRFVDQNNTSFYADPAGTSQFNDMRASIFYDRNNTAYYVNPASTSNLNVVRAASVAIGTITPASELHYAHISGVGNGFTLQNSIDADEWEMYVFSTNDLTLYFNGSQKGAFDDVSGNYIPSSDKKLKKNIEPVVGMMDKILKLKPSIYHFNEQSNSDTRKYYGLIAQEVEQVIPEIAIYHDEADQYGVSYTELIPILIAGMQEQQELIDALSERLKKLEQ